jgi:hypothetical protein
MTGRAARRFLALALCAAFLAGCASPLKRAKVHYARAQDLDRSYESGPAAAAMKRALLEADAAARKNPTAQAYTLKGLAEVRLERWADAAESFRRAFAFGFASGEQWAADVALLGAALGFEASGLADAAGRAYAHLMARSRFAPVRTAAAGKHVDLALSRALAAGHKDRDKALAGLVKDVGRLLDDDYASGFAHYLLSQVLAHRGELRPSYEEAVLARELGLPSEKVLRDNDNQIVFCRDRIREALGPEERAAFDAVHDAWTARWGWRDARTPPWKKE